MDIHKGAYMGEKPQLRRDATILLSPSLPQNEYINKRKEYLAIAIPLPVPRTKTVTEHKNGIASYEYVFLRHFEKSRDVLKP